MIGTLVSTLVCVGVMNFQVSIPGICDPDDPPMRFTCPGIYTFFTASVLVGSNRSGFLQFLSISGASPKASTLTLVISTSPHQQRHTWEVFLPKHKATF